MSEAERPALMPAPELTIIVPTFNERGNVAEMVARLTRALVGVDWEVLFVDDNSPDGTAAHVRAIGRSDRRVRCIRRIGRRGLAGACLEGALACGSDLVAVMDGDLQHDETCLTKMLARLRQGDVDLVVASRYIEGGSASSFSPLRLRISRFATELAHRFLKVELSDPMSGFFMMRRSALEELAPSLSSQGFKILLDIVATARGRLRIAEVAFVFRDREHGESKLDGRVALDFVALTMGKLTSDIISSRFILFCTVGLTGLGVHMLLLRTALTANLPFATAQAVSTFLVIMWNFALNNALTYRDQRLRGWRFLGGLVRFEIACAFGLISNIGIASWVYGAGTRWWLAGLTGALMGSVWNYAISSTIVWKQR